jgi:hypothetical protein
VNPLYKVHLKVTEAATQNGVDVDGKVVAETVMVRSAAELGGDPTSCSGVMQALAKLVYTGPDVPFAGA